MSSLTSLTSLGLFRLCGLKIILSNLKARFNTVKSESFQFATITGNGSTPSRAHRKRYRRRPHSELLTWMPCCLTLWNFSSRSIECASASEFCSDGITSTICGMLPRSFRSFNASNACLASHSLTLPICAVDTLLLIRFVSRKDKLYVHTLLFSLSPLRHLCATTYCA